MHPSIMKENDNLIIRYLGIIEILIGFAIIYKANIIKIFGLVYYILHLLFIRN